MFYIKAVLTFISTLLGFVFFVGVLVFSKTINYERATFALCFLIMCLLVTLVIDSMEYKKF